MSKEIKISTNNSNKSSRGSQTPVCKPIPMPKIQPPKPPKK